MSATPLTFERGGGCLVQGGVVLAFIGTVGGLGNAWQALGEDAGDPFWTWASVLVALLLWGAGMAAVLARQGITLDNGRVVRWRRVGPYVDQEAVPFSAVRAVRVVREQVRERHRTALTMHRVELDVDAGEGAADPWVVLASGDFERVRVAAEELAHALGCAVTFRA